jgi:hypothetical protein
MIRVGLLMVWAGGVLSLSGIGIVVGGPLVLAGLAVSLAGSA